jgi:arylsulfatase A-like enzyme
MYGDFLMMVDAEIGRVLATLDEEGMTEHTLLVFSSDNGPVWYDEDVKRFGHDASGGFRGMKGDAWEAGHRMPFIVRWPGVVDPGSVSDQLIGFPDVLSTMAELTGSPLPEGSRTDSYSFLPVLKGDQAEDQPVRKVWAMESANGTLVLRSGSWKLINRLGSGGFSKPGLITPGPDDPAGQLYDLAKDPGETTNLYLERSDVVERLTKELGQLTRE